MSYNKHTWATGNVVGAVDLNRIENGIADIDIDEIRGWGMQETQLFSESVTTTVDPEYPDEPAWADFVYNTQITAESITVTFNGTDYICTRITAYETGGFVEYAYGGLNNDGPDFTNYPFYIYTDSNGNNGVGTQTAGTYTVAVSADAIEVSDTFSDAVNMAVVIPDVSTMPFRCIDGQTTYVDMQSAFQSGRPLYFYASATCFYITGVSINSITFFPESQHVSAAFVNNIFTVTLT